MQLFCLQLEASCLQGSFFTYTCVWELFCLQLELCCLQFGLFGLQLELFYLQWESVSNKHLTDSKQNSSTVSRKLPIVSKNAASALKNNLGRNFLT